MKTLIIPFIILILNHAIYAQEDQGITLTITLENVLNNEGQILAALHEENTFMKGPGIENLQAGASQGEMILRFTHVQPGTYAVSVLHDANNNNRMDFELNGMPKEAYAMSGQMNLMEPPTFSDTKFEVGKEDLELRIRF